VVSSSSSSFSLPARSDREIVVVAAFGLVLITIPLSARFVKDEIELMIEVSFSLPLLGL